MRLSVACAGCKSESKASIHTESEDIEGEILATIITVIIIRDNK